MKVCHVVWGLGLGGIETMLVNIANEQVSYSSEVSIIVINNNFDESLVQSLNPNINIYFIGRKPGSINLFFIAKLNMVIYNINPDIIHLHRSDIAKLLCSFLFRKKICVTLHDLPKGSLVGNNIFVTACHKLLRLPTLYSNVVGMNTIRHVFSISNAVQQQLKDNYGIASTVVCNGIVTKRFNQRKKTKATKPFRIVMVSRLLHEKKGQDLLIEAADKLRGQVIVDFIGVGASMSFLQGITRELHLEEYVNFLGKQTQNYIAEHLADYDLFVQPSRWEGFGLTVAEAMAANLPVLVSEGQGPAEVTCGDMYGWMFKNGDASDLANQISYITTHYSEAVRKASAAQLFVRDTYDVSVTARTYLTEYKNIIDKQSHESR